ncbi:MAG: AsnC family transcriptional regulator [Candidatus Thorarchaeota archaeon]
MDLIDKKIIMELDANCRTTFETLAQQNCITANAVRKRFAKLIDSGFIVRFMVILESAMIGADLMLALVHTDGSENDEAFIQKIGGHPMVLEVSYVASVTGGIYNIFAQHIGAEGLSEIGRFLRRFDAVTKVEMHTLLYNAGKKTELSKTQLIVLRILREDPRMRIVEIAEKSGLTARRVRRTIQTLVDGESVHFTLRWDLNAMGRTKIHIKINWDTNETTAEELVNWLEEEYPLEFWFPLISATEPVVFATFSVESLQEAENISRRIRQAPFVNSTANLVCYSNTKFPWLGETYLDKMILDADL